MSGNRDAADGDSVLHGDASRRVAELVALLSPQYAEVRAGHSDDVLGFDDPAVGAAVVTELRSLPRQRQTLPGQEPASSAAAELRLALLANPHQRDVLLGLLAPVNDIALRLDRPQVFSRDAVRGVGAFVHRQIASIAMNVLIVLAVGGAALLWQSSSPSGPAAPSGGVESRALRVFVIWVLAFTPGWMFVRFIGQRAGGLWDDYVISLHRLGVDHPANLPQPLLRSPYYESWRTGGGPLRSRLRTVYQQKFDAYYGKYVSRTAVDPDARLRTEALFPVFLLTSVLAVGWTAALWRPGVFEPPGDRPLPLAGALAFAYLGSYCFVIQMLVRRFFQSDLRTSAYASATVRTVTVLVLVTVLHHLPGLAHDTSPDREVFVAFIVGFFPLVGLQAIQRVATGILKVALPSLRSDHPLSELDGLNVWYEARLLEEGIEDVQNLATAPMVDVILHTKVPVGRLVDWVDQSLLLLHLDPPERPLTAGPRQRRKAVRDSDKGVLRRYGVRTATDLLKAFPPSAEDPAVRLIDPDGLAKVFGEPRLRSLLRVLVQEPALRPVLRWQAPPPGAD